MTDAKQGGDGRIRAVVAEWEMAEAAKTDRRGWNSEFAKPYKPLGVPKLDLAAPRDILRQRENVQKSFGQGRQTTSANGRQSEKINNLLLHSSRSTGREVMHTASDDMQQRIKAAHPALQRVKAGQPFLKVVGAPPAEPEHMALESSARVAVTNAIENKDDLGQMLGPARWLASARKRLKKESGMSSTSRTRGMRSTSRIDSFRSVASDTSGPAAFDIAQQVVCLFAAGYVQEMMGKKERQRPLDDPTRPYIKFDIVAHLDSLSSHEGKRANATMRRTLRPTKSAMAPTGNRMLDIAIRMAGTLEQQEKEAAEAAAADGDATQDTPFQIDVVRQEFNAVSLDKDQALQKRLERLSRDRCSNYRKKVHNLQVELQHNCNGLGLTDPGRELEAIRFRSRMEAVQVLNTPLLFTSYTMTIPG
ncbi:TPA: hypothetical protein ACH3X1_009473 [Trebouxia sp. C0004]